MWGRGLSLRNSGPCEEYPPITAGLPNIWGISLMWSWTNIQVDDDLRGHGDHVTSLQCSRAVEFL